MQVRTNPEKRLVIWNKLEDLQTATNPPIGGQWDESGTTLYGTGEFGTCFSNTGLNTRIRRLDKFTDTGFILERGTIDLWVKWNAFTGGTYVIDLAIDTQTNFLLSIFMQADGKILFSAGKTGDSTTALSSVLTTGSFFHITCQWDINGIEGGANILRIYIDGSLDGTSDTAILIDNTSASESFHIGSSRLNADDIDGFIDNLKCYNFVNADARTNTTEGDRNVTGTNIQLNKNELLVSWLTFNNDGIAEFGPNYNEFGTVVYSAGQFGDAYDNTATGNNYLISSVFWDNFMSLDKGTIEFWVNFDTLSPPAPNVVFYHFFGPGSQSGVCFLSSNGIMTFGINKGDFSPGNVNLDFDTSSLSTGVWYHFAYVYNINGIDGGSNKVRLYFDGALSLSDNTSYGTTADNAISGFQISRFSNINGRSITGLFDNLKISNFDKTNFATRLSEGVERLSEFRFNPDEKLVLWHKINDASGQSVIGEGATYTGTHTFAACKFKQGSDITAGTEYIDIEQFPGQKGTVEIWIKTHFDDTANEQNYFIDSPIDSLVRVHMRYSSDTEFHFGLFYAGTGYEINTTDIAFSTNDVIHLAGVWDTDGIQGTSDRTRLYVNGVLEASATGAIATLTQTSIRLGRNPINIGTFANAVIEDFKLYNYAITEFKDRDQQEIMDIAKNPEHYLKGMY